MTDGPTNSSAGERMRVVSMRSDSAWVRVFRTGLILVGASLVAMSVVWGPDELGPGGSMTMALMYAAFIAVGVRAVWQGLTGTGKLFEEARADANELRELMISKGASTSMFDSRLPSTEADQLKSALRPSESATGRSRASATAGHKGDAKH